MKCVGVPLLGIPDHIPEPLQDLKHILVFGSLSKKHTNNLKMALGSAVEAGQGDSYMGLISPNRKCTLSHHNKVCCHL